MRELLLLNLMFSFVLSSVVFGQVKQGAWTPVVETMDRGYTSISYWTYRDDGVEIGGGRISVEHGKPRWPTGLDEPTRFDETTKGKLWRFGNNKWSTLDTQLTLHFGERRVSPGIYYLALERDDAGEWSLAFIDPVRMRRPLIDAWAIQARPSEVPIQFSVPLEYSTGMKASQLQLELKLDDQDMGQASLHVYWGPHQLEARFAISVPAPDFYKRGGSGQ